MSLGGILSLSDRLPRITVITPSLNQGEFIRQTVDSVVSQGYPELDYWVIDGGSSDGTLSILRSYQNALRYISEPDAGQAEAVNKGFHRATGDVIGWLNSDDMYLPGALETVGIFFRDHPDTAVLYGDAYYCDDSGKILEPYPTRDFDWESFSSECYVCQPSVFFRRRVLEDVGVLESSASFLNGLRFLDQGLSITPSAAHPSISVGFEDVLAQQDIVKPPGRSGGDHPGSSTSLRPRTV